MSASAKYTDRLMELLVQRATDGLNASEQVELNRLLGQGKHLDGQQFEQTAAALLLAGVGEEEPMPEALRAKLLIQAEAYTGNMVTKSATANIPMVDPSLASRRRVPARPAALTTHRWAWLAAAASVMLAVAGWWPRLGAKDDVEQQREQLLAEQSTVQRKWQVTEDPAAKGVSGDVIWNQATQVGYMRFRGLASNNPQHVQYQLWIFDRARGDKYPVDGGIFDIPANQGEVVVPITARLPVRDPAMFAVTMEQAGGTVVSERDHIVVLAKIAS